MTKRTIRLTSLIIVVMMLASCLFAFAACVDDSTTTYYNNETDYLVFSTLEVDKVFNPFFSTSGTDSNVIGMTQISMIGNDEDGNYTYGDDEAVVAKDVAIVSNGGVKDVDLTTTYYFVLKNNVLYSNGSPLTIKDVLFNLYVYLDPVYTGSSTIYSTDIVGLSEYRTQTRDEKEQDAFSSKYKIAARARIDALIEAATEIINEHPEVDVAEMTSYLANDWENISDAYKYLTKDFASAQTLFLEELQQDYNNSRDSYSDTVFTDKNGEIYRNLLTTDVEMFLYNEGYITWNKNEGKLYCSFVTDEEDWAEMRTWSQDKAIELVYNAKMPSKLDEILQYWATATTLYEQLVNEEMSNDTPEDGALAIPNIEGIKFANYSEGVTVNGNYYAVPEYETITDDDGNTCQKVKDGSYEVLSITINNVDPKAIWNFGFAIAPMYYYSDAEHIASFDYANNKFGVEYRNSDFMNNVVKDPTKIGVPVGAGPYAASKASGGLANVTAADFYDKGVIYFERNPHYVMGPATIKSIRYQVVSSNSMLDSLYTSAVDFAEPNAKPETQTELRGKKSEGLEFTTISTMGYGYIGINAGKIPSVYVRRAIMYCIDTQMTVSYYGNLASPIYRSMSKNSWAYPTGCSAYYPYIGDAIPSEAELENVDPDYVEYITKMGYSSGYTMTKEEQQAFIVWLLEDKAGYTLGANGIYANNGKNECKFEFTIAGQETDHPAYSAMFKAAQFLNEVGFSVKVRTDNDALSKLTTGSLTVWAAAWSSTIDPDMYQVYHKDSTATSVLNWGYTQIYNDTTKYAYEAGIIDELSELIEEGRTTNDQAERKQIYSDALDLVMQLAVELPTYQRNDLYAYNASKIDTSSFFQNATSMKGLTSEINTVSLIVAK